MTEIWPLLQAECRDRAQAEPHLDNFLRDAVLRWRCPVDALGYRLARRLCGPAEGLGLLYGALALALEADPAIARAAAADLRAYRQRDPACTQLHLPFLFYKGFHAVQVQRAAHWHWQQRNFTTACLLQHRCSEALAVDIHPAAVIGCGVMLDHATGFVAGETTVIEDDVSLLHGVTLGGTGKQRGDRHPKVRRGAVLGAGALVLGNIDIGAGARVGAGSVVLQSVPSAGTAVGGCARLVQRRSSAAPARLPQAAVEALFDPA